MVADPGKSADDDSLTASAMYHSLSSRIDTTINSKDVTFNSHAFWKNEYTYASPALGNATMMWKDQGGKLHDQDVVCLDGKGCVWSAVCFWQLK